MATLERLAALDLRQAVTRFRDALRAHQDELNRLNVYPVPDGDTGTNMTLTLESVVHELGTAEDMAEVCQAVAHGSLMGARGNSGVILSQILRGLADTFRTLEAAGGSDVAVGLRQASDAAYEAVMRPVEGTILTVVRAAADAAEAARDAVEHTPDLLPVLREAGVVDAGGRGFTLLLDALLEVVAGRPIPDPDVVFTPVSVEAHLAGDDVASLRYEVMYLLEAEDPTIKAFKETWAALGDSIVVVGGDGSGTATCTRTTSGARSRRASKPGGRARSASRICSSRSRKSTGCARTRTRHPTARARRPARPWRRRSWRSGSAKG